MKIKTFGSRCITSQILRIDSAFKKLGHELIHDSECNLIYCNDPGEFDLAIDYKKKYPNSKLIMTILDCPIHIPEYRYWIDKVGIQLLMADAVCAISETVKKHLNNTFPFLQQKQVHIIYNPIKPVKPLNLERQNRLLVIGRAMDKNKRTNIAIELAGLINIPLDVIGPEDVTPLLKNNYKNIVSYKGIVTDKELNIEYNNHIATLIVSKVEGLNLPLIESLVTKTPVVCCEDMETAREFCPPEFISRNSTYDLYNKLQYILNNKDKMEPILEEYSSKYIEQFSSKSVTERILKVYDRIK